MSDNTYHKAYCRERQARHLAEALLEEKTQRLYAANQLLQKNNRKLRENQRALIQSEKMASVGTLAAGVAHEINNPIGFSLSNIHVLSDYLKRLDSEIDSDDMETLNILEDSNDLIRETIDGLNRVTRIVRDLQGLTRKSDEIKKHADINAAIHSTLNVINSRIKYRCDVKLDLGDLPPVVCDISKINQILLNIILNAAQSIEEQGLVWIKTCRLGEFILIEIEDNGCGIDESDLNKVFTPFFTTKETGEGTGLGLSVCYSIIKEHGGDIDITSKNNAGTIVRITLPIDHKEVEVA